MNKRDKDVLSGAHLEFITDYIGMDFSTRWPKYLTTITSVRSKCPFRQNTGRHSPSLLTRSVIQDSLSNSLC